MPHERSLVTSTSDEQSQATVLGRREKGNGDSVRQWWSSTMCGEVGLVIRLHLLFGEVRIVTTALKAVEEVQQGRQEIGGE